MGTGVFIISSIAEVKFESLVKAIMPFLAMALFLLLVITDWSDLVLLVPRTFGL
ncbi:MAG TPA: TRAP transporter large permease subunit [Bacillaceae bacterium]